MPERLQLSRKKGFRLPLNAKSVSRPHRWGNPFVVWRNGDWYADTWDAADKHMGFAVKCADNLTARKIACEAYKAALDAESTLVPTKAEVRKLRGLDLACWCPGPPYDADAWARKQRKGEA